MGEMRAAHPRPTLADGKRQAEDDRNAARVELTHLREETDAQRRLSDRRWWARLGYLMSALLAVIALMQPNPMWLAAIGLGFLLVWNAATKWTSNLDERWRTLAPGIALEVLGIVFALALQT